MWHHSARQRCLLLLHLSTQSNQAVLWKKYAIYINTLHVLWNMGRTQKLACVWQIRTRSLWWSIRWNRKLWFTQTGSWRVRSPQRRQWWRGLHLGPGRWPELQLLFLLLLPICSISPHVPQIQQDILKDETREVFLLIRTTGGVLLCEQTCKKLYMEDTSLSNKCFDYKLSVSRFCGV